MSEAEQFIEYMRRGWASGIYRVDTNIWRAMWKNSSGHELNEEASDPLIAMKLVNDRLRLRAIMAVTDALENC